MIVDFVSGVGLERKPGGVADRLGWGFGADIDAEEEVEAELLEEAVDGDELSVEVG